MRLLYSDSRARVEVKIQLHPTKHHRTSDSIINSIIKPVNAPRRCKILKEEHDRVPNHRQNQETDIFHSK